MNKVVGFLGLTFLLVACSGNVGESQGKVMVWGNWKGGENNKVFLIADWTVDPAVADSALVETGGVFRFKNISAQPHGVYSFFLGSHNSGPLIWNGDEVTVEVSDDNAIPHSPENDLLQDFLQKIDGHEGKVQHLNEKYLSLEENEKSTDAEKESIMASVVDELKQRNSFIRKWSDEHQNSFFGKHYAKAFLMPLLSEHPEWKDQYEDEFAFFETHWFDPFSLEDPALYRAPFLHQKLVLYSENYAPREPNQVKKVAEDLMKKASGNAEAKNALAKILLRHFRDHGPDEVFVWLSEEGIEGCESNVMESNMKDRAAIIRALQPGNPSPDFTIPLTTGEKLSPKSLNGKHILLIFWATTCQHCNEELPELAYFLEPYKNLITVGVSVDPLKEDWETGMRIMGLGGWTNMNDYKGWDSPIVKTFGIRRTPGKFLISPDGKIVMKDPSPAELKEKIKAIFP